jgi:hypothetical protein
MIITFFTGRGVNKRDKNENNVRVQNSHKALMSLPSPLGKFLPNYLFGYIYKVSSSKII